MNYESWLSFFSPSTFREASLARESVLTVENAQQDYCVTALKGEMSGILQFHYYSNMIPPALP